MNPDDLARILDELANRLGPGGEYVFGLAVRQAAIEGWTMAILFAVSAVILALSVTKWWQAFDMTDYDATLPPSGYVAFFAAVGVFIFGAALVFGGIGRLLNPEYAALTDILSRIVP